MDAGPTTSPLGRAEPLAPVHAVPLPRAGGGRDPLMWLGVALLVAGAALPHRLLADAVAAAGGAADLHDGFLLLRVVLAGVGVFLAAAAHWELGRSCIGVVRVPAAEGAWLDRSHMAGLTALLLLATALRLPALDAQYWIDEMFTVVDFVRPSFIAIVTSFESQNNHPLYSLLANAVVAVMGESPSALRLPAMLFGVASIGAAYWFAVQVTSRTEAFLAAALLTVSYHHVWFSQNARSYTALLFFTLIGTGLFLRMCREQTASARATALAYAAVMTLAVYAHMTAALVVVGHFLVWTAAVAVRGRWRDAWRAAPLFAVAVAGAFSLVLYAPGLGHIAAGLDGGGEQVDMVWKNPLWMLMETARGLARGIPGGLPAVAVAAVLPLAGLVSYAARDRVLAALMIVPAVLTAALLVATGHNLWPRFFFFAAGFAILILIRGIFALVARQRFMPAHASATVITVILILGSTVLLPAAWGAKQDFTGARDYIESTRAPGEAVAVTGITDWVYHDFYATDFTSVEDAASLRRLTSTGERVWLVHVMPELIAALEPELWSAMQEFEEVATFRGTLAGGTVHIGVSR